MKVLAVVLLAMWLWMPFSATKLELPVANISSKVQMVEAAAVVKALQQKAEYVGSQGSLTKQFIFSDQMFNTDYNMINDLGKRQTTVELKATYKLGFDLNTITSASVVVRDDTILIVSPPIKIISVEIPFNEIKYTDKVGLLAKPYNIEQQQQLFGVCKEKIMAEITSPGNLRKATEQTQDSITKWLMTIPNVKKVQFI